MDNNEKKKKRFFNSRKIRLSFNPYTFVRTAVMKTKLLKAEDYETMLKLSSEELLNFLQSKGYTQLSSLRMSYAGIELLEEAIKQNMAASFEKLKRISDEKLAVVIDAYLFRYDINNIKIVIRFWKSEDKNTNNIEDASKLFFPIGNYNLDFYTELLKIGKEKSISKLKNTKFDFIADCIKENKNLFFIETELDKMYYNYLFELANKLGKQSGLMKAFIEEEIISKNIVALLKLSSFSKDEAQKVSAGRFIIDLGKSKIANIINELKNAKTIDKKIKILENLRYKSFKDSLEKAKNGQFAPLEYDMQKYMLKRIKRISLSNILSVDTILSYIFLKDLEARNILTLYKLKSFGFDADEIKKRIVV